MKNIKIILLFLFLLGITIFSVIKYAGTLREKYDLESTVEDMRIEVTDLQNVKNNLLASLEREKVTNNGLSESNTQLQEDLRENEKKLTQLDGQLKEALIAIEALNSQIASVQTENAALQEQKEKLTLALAQVSGEKETLQTRMSSVTELKKMIKELKRNMRKTAEVIQRKVVRKKEENSVMGNRGFLIKDGKPTFLPRIRIEVEPIS